MNTAHQIKKGINLIVLSVVTIFFLNLLKRSNLSSFINAMIKCILCLGTLVSGELFDLLAVCVLAKGHAQTRAMWANHIVIMC